MLGHWPRRNGLALPALGGADDQQQVSALDLLDVGEQGAVDGAGYGGGGMPASIFIASMVATLWPASTVSPSATVRLTAPAKGAATWLGSSASARSAETAVTSHGLVADHDLAQLPVEGGHHHPHALLIGRGDGLQGHQQTDTLAQGDDVLVVGGHPVEEVSGVQHLQVAVGLVGGLVVAGGPGNSSRFSAALRVAESASKASVSSAESSSVTGLTVRPSSALDRKGSGQPAGGSPSWPARNPMTESGRS